MLVRGYSDTLGLVSVCVQTHFRVGSLKCFRLIKTAGNWFATSCLVGSFTAQTTGLLTQIPRDGKVCNVPVARVACVADGYNLPICLAQALLLRLAHRQEGVPVDDCAVEHDRVNVIDGRDICAWISIEKQ